MKPVTGRPKNVTPTPVKPVVPMALVLSSWKRSETLEPMPRVVAPMPVKDRRPQPFWKPVVTVTFVTLNEPRTPDCAVDVGICAAPLRIDRTFDSQHIEFGEAPGGSGEKSAPAAV